MMSFTGPAWRLRQEGRVVLLYGVSRGTLGSQEPGARSLTLQPSTPKPRLMPSFPFRSDLMQAIVTPLLRWTALAILPLTLVLTPLAAQQVERYTIAAGGDVAVYNLA